MEDANAVSMLVFGAEDNFVYILESDALNVVTKVELESVPVFMAISGLYDVEYSEGREY
jgi:Bardet-Biedl syndrome 1 protein